MEDTDQAERLKWHKTMAVDSFNLTWDLLDNKSRTQADDDRMVHAAHASRFHWGEVGGPLNLARGEWQISRVYSVLRRPVQAEFHARRSLELCLANNITDFDLAFAYEALARAGAIARNRPAAESNLVLARSAARQVADKANRDYVEAELATIVLP
jgi:hypothetical protein